MSGNNNGFSYKSHGTNNQVCQMKDVQITHSAARPLRLLLLLLLYVVHICRDSRLRTQPNEEEKKLTPRLSRLLFTHRAITTVPETTARAHVTRTRTTTPTRKFSSLLSFCSSSLPRRPPIRTCSSLTLTHLAIGPVLDL